MVDGTVAGGAAPRRISVILARLAQAKDADLLLREALDAAIDIAGADMGNIQLLEPANGSLKIGASRGFSAPFLDFFATVSAHTNSACGATLVNRMRIMVEDVATSYLFVATPALDIMLVANARGVHSTPLEQQRSPHGRDVDALAASIARHALRYGSAQSACGRLGRSPPGDRKSALHPGRQHSRE